MADVFSKAKRSEVMARISGSGNRATELQMVRLFKKFGVVGWRRKQVLRVSTPRGIRPDFVFRDRRIAVFVDGEFWHGHPTRARIPKTNHEFWAEKIRANVRRDRRQNRELRAAGWSVVRIWQHELATSRAIAKCEAAGLIASAQIEDCQPKRVRMGVTPSR